MGQLSDPYKQGEDDGLQISVSGLPEDIEEPVADDPGLDDDAEVDERSDASDASDDDEAESDDDTADDEEDADEDGEGEEEVAYELEGWDNNQLDALFDSLDEANIPFNWDGEELFIKLDDEQTVDGLIEKAAHPHQLAAEEDEDGDGGGWLLGELFVVADRLQHDPEEHESVALLLQLANAADESDAPYGLSDEEWNALREKVTGLATVLEADKPDADAAIEAARELRTVTRPYV